MIWSKNIRYVPFLDTMNSSTSTPIEGWAVPTIVPVLMRLSWWAEPTLLKSCWDDADVGQQCVCPLLNESDLIDVDLANSVFQLAIADKRYRITGSKR